MTLTNYRYVLDASGEPVVEPDLLTWARWFEANFEQCQVARTEVGDVHVSTVFLGTDRSVIFGGGPPVLYETMIFGGTHNNYNWLYSTRVQALAGHDQIVAAVRDGREPSVGAE